MQYKKLITLALSLFFIVDYSNAYAIEAIKPPPNNINTPHYRIVLDAGNNKTRLFLYQYTQGDTVPKNIHTLSERIHSPGVADIAIIDLSDYLDFLFTSELAAQIQALITDGQTNISRALLTHIQFYSTEGMRLLSPQERASKNTFIRLWLTNWVRIHNIKIPPQEIEIRTLSGSEEGAYAWVATNYSQHHFQGALTGIAKLGGSSSQITYLDPNLTNVSVKVGNTRYPLTSNNYPLGQDVIAKQLANVDACYLTGYTNTSNGDYFSCQAQAKAFIRTQTNMPVPNAAEVVHYNLLANFYYTAHFFGIENNYSLSSLQTQAEQFCNLNWETAKAEHTDVDEKYLANYCMGAAYQATLLTYNYHMNSFQQLSPINEFNHQEISWPMGVIVTQQYLEIN
ncbi:hypothetical protein [Shewanella surugensis]|uniref:Uncharacterized protein n=1 Tax=Shewanella surugensis TaxID=212020 RepID=A0ABT0L9S3_9GAMM|nr:hypothetical protein [Shewanella surugensis]MCL1124314.1 hypothetical protein [Shewanella surugensis]